MRRWEELISVGGGVSTDVFLAPTESGTSSGEETKTIPCVTATSVHRPRREASPSENTLETTAGERLDAGLVEGGRNVRAEPKGRLKTGASDMRPCSGYQTNGRLTTETGVEVAMNALNIAAQEISHDSTERHLATENILDAEGTFLTSFTTSNKYYPLPPSAVTTSHHPPPLPSSVRLSVHARATMLGEDYPVANIVLVRVEVKCHSEHVPVHYRVGVIAPVRCLPLCAGNPCMNF